MPSDIVHYHQMLLLEHCICNHLIPVSCFPCLADVTVKFWNVTTCPIQHTTLCFWCPANAAFFWLSLICMLSLHLYMHVYVAPAPGRWQGNPWLLCYLHTEHILYLVKFNAHQYIQNVLVRFTKYAMVHNDPFLSVRAWPWLRMRSTFTTFQSLGNMDLSSSGVKKYSDFFFQPPFKKMSFL